MIRFEIQHDPAVADALTREVDGIDGEAARIRVPEAFTRQIQEGADIGGMGNRLRSLRPTVFGAGSLGGAMSLALIPAVVAYLHRIEAMYVRLAEKQEVAGRAAAAAVASAGYGDVRGGSVARDLVDSFHGSRGAGALTTGGTAASFAAVASGGLQSRPGQGNEDLVRIRTIAEVLHLGGPAIQGMAAAQRDAALRVAARAVGAGQDTRRAVSVGITVSAGGNAELFERLLMAGLPVDTAARISIAVRRTSSKPEGVEEAVSIAATGLDRRRLPVSGDLEARVLAVLADPGRFGITGRRAAEMRVLARGIARTGDVVERYEAVATAHRLDRELALAAARQRVERADIMYRRLAVGAEERVQRRLASLEMRGYPADGLLGRLYGRGGEYTDRLIGEVPVLGLLYGMVAGGPDTHRGIRNRMRNDQRGSFESLDDDSGSFRSRDVAGAQWMASKVGQYISNTSSKKKFEELLKFLATEGDRRALIEAAKANVGSPMDVKIKLKPGMTLDDFAPALKNSARAQKIARIASSASRILGVTAFVDTGLAIATDMSTEGVDRQDGFIEMRRALDALIEAVRDNATPESQSFDSGMPLL